METHKLLKARLRDVLVQLPNLPRAIRLAWTATRGWTSGWLVLLLIQGLLPVATVYLIRWLVNSLVPALGSNGGWQSFRPIVLPMCLLAVLFLLGELLRSATVWVRTAQAELLRDHISGLVHAKSVEIDLAFYDLPEFYDRLHRARDESSYRPVELLESMGSLLQDGVTLFAMGAVLLPFGAWLPAVVLVSTLPALYVVIRHTLLHHQWRLKTTSDERRGWYYDWLLTSREAAAELRLFGMGPGFQSAYQALRQKLREERVQMAGKQGLAELAAGSFGLLITGAVLSWMVWKAVRGIVSLGDLALFYQAFHQGQQLMRSLLQNVGHLYSNSLFLGNLFEFLALQPKVVENHHPRSLPVTRAPGIRFDHVKFRYQGSSHPTLDDFCLDIPAGQRVAIVGLNGAGKSTLIKLLCRFYDPDEGAIELDGIDLRDLTIEHLRQQITVLFQEPVHFNNTVAENIALGNPTVVPEPGEVVAAARAAGADVFVQRLPQRYDSSLGKWFHNGAELSVGEWQRVALARAFFRKSPIILLDEPTSAMDPWAEADWLERFSWLSRDRTAVIITHRFTTAMCADMIHVMVEGQIVESGRHEQLLNLGGRYADLWAFQIRQEHGLQHPIGRR